MAKRKMIMDRIVSRGFDIQKTGKCYFWFITNLDEIGLLRLERKFLEKTLDK